MANAKPKNTFKGQRFTTPVGRASYPAIFKPKLKYQKTDEYEYSIELLYDKKTDHSEFKKKCDLALAEVYGNDKKKWPANIVYPLADQEILIDKIVQKGTGGSIDHLAPGSLYARFKTNAKNRPLVVDEDMNEVIDETKVYGGCFVRVSGTLKVNEINGIDPSTRKPIKTIYVTPYLAGVQFVKDGESFGGKLSAADMFQPVALEEDEEDLIG